MKKIMNCFNFTKPRRPLPNSDRQNPGQTSNVNAGIPSSSNVNNAGIPSSSNANNAAIPSSSNANAGIPSSSNAVVASTSGFRPGGLTPVANLATGVRRFTYDELSNATEGFKPELILGRGGSSTVYKGKLLDTNEVVAVKYLNADTGQYKGTKYEFEVEVSMLSRANHPNLVKLIGFCKDESRNVRMVVYEYLPLGSLDSHLHELPADSEGLGWSTRIDIAYGIAKGLNYLHHVMQPPMIYRDLKGANVLLGEGYHTKLSDFGLAKKGPTGDVTQVRSRIMGTYGYCAPEYGSSGYMTYKSDIYSFGVVLLELLTGKKATFLTRDGRQVYLSNWVVPTLYDQNKKMEYLELRDPTLGQDYPPTGMVRALTTAKMCIDEENLRPTAADLVNTVGFLSRQGYDPGIPRYGYSELRRTRSAFQ